ncbi:uncharacterized protein LOC129717344 [Wyeomyia smithii]|uniref:uncharacterized protein LOC129717344 n=1 Tax=Wyeomyia smithii TaxID=174621 RepID=UPI0024681396|nr:uncharacterized protein LOC129717344 [Wyeomyia smithii]
MGDPNPLDPVPQFILRRNYVSCHQSRSGATLEFEEGASQLSSSGKYTIFSNSSIPDQLPCSSLPPADFSPDTALPTSGTLGCTSSRTMEVSDPPAVVEPFLPAFISHPGPTGGSGERDFQNATHGKYNFVISVPSADPYCTFSLRQLDVPPPVFAERSLAADNHSSGLRIYYQNVRGLRTKIDDFFLTATECDHNIIVLTETWLDDHIDSAQFCGSLFTVYRCDRNRHNSCKSRGGGVLIAVSKRLNSCVDPAPISDTIELWIRISMPTRSISLGVVYLPPDRRSDMTAVKNHINSISSVTSRLDQNDLSFLFGDYNQPGVIWKRGSDSIPSIDLIHSRISVACSALLDGFSLNNLTQVNHATNDYDRLLDLVLVNDATSCELTEASESLLPLDTNHPALNITIDVTVPVQFEDIGDVPCLDFCRADFESLSIAFSCIDWQFLESSPPINDAVEYFNCAINSAIYRIVPPRRPLRKPAWSNPRLRHLKKQRSTALRHYCKARCPISKHRFNEISKLYRKYNRFLYKRYTSRMQGNLRRNPRLFWSFVNSKRKEDGLPVDMFLGDCHGSTLLEKCTLFARSLQHNFHEHTASDAQVDTALSYLPRDDFNLLEITSRHITTAIDKLKSSFAVGPDGIPSCVLKRCASVLIHPLCLLFSLSLRQRVFPSSWKSSIMFPVYKKGDRRDVKNYRGITSLCACSKVMEIIVNDALFDSCKHYITSDQHGFYPKRSITTKLAEFSSTCLRNMSNGAQIDAV